MFEIRDSGLNDLKKLLHAAVVTRLGLLEFRVSNPEFMDPTVGPYPGPHADSRGFRVSYERGSPVQW